MMLYFAEHIKLMEAKKTADELAKEFLGDKERVTLSAEQDSILRDALDIGDWMTTNFGKFRLMRKGPHRGTSSLIRIEKEGFKGLTFGDVIPGQVFLFKGERYRKTGKRDARRIDPPGGERGFEDHWEVSFIRDWQWGDEAGGGFGRVKGSYIIDPHPQLKPPS